MDPEARARLKSLIYVTKATFPYVLPLLILIVLFLWPGIFRYTYSGQDSAMTRVDRITGEVQIWHKRYYLGPTWMTKEAAEAEEAEEVADVK
jgi:hypothetical protein